MRALILVVAVAGCIDADPAPDRTLVNDERYSMTLPYYQTPEECLAVNSPVAYICTFELELCRDGTAGLRSRDVVTYGEYRLEHKVARGELGGAPFEFDLEAHRGMGAAASVSDGFWLPDSGGRWKTLEWDVGGCTP